MKAKLMSLLKSPSTYVILAVGMLLGVAYGVKSALVRKTAGYLPGSATKAAPAA